MKLNLLHNDFLLNKNYFSSKKELLLYTKDSVTEAHSFLLKWFDGSDFIEVYTSGSTGKPKSIKLRKVYMVNSAIATGNYFNLSSKTKVLHCLPMNFIAGKMMLIRAIVLGWHLDIVTANSYPLKNISKKYDFSAMVPLQLSNSLNRLYLIKKLIIGGGSVSKHLQFKIENSPTKIYATYGMTETITHIAIKSINKVSKKKSGDNNYKILPDVSISVDSRKCLIIKAPMLSDAIVKTNDIVELGSDNKCFNWLGRYDNIINSGGVKLIPEQIEEKISKIISNRFFITSIPDDILGYKVVLIIENESKSFNIKEKLKKDISNLKNLSRFEVPKEIFYIDNFKLTKTNKIDRNKTKDLVLSQS